jgi:hypothetical protein
MPKAHRSPAPSPATQPRRRPKNLRPAEARRLLVAFCTGHMPARIASKPLAEGRSVT